MIRYRISFTFDPKSMLLSLQDGFRFARAAVACTIIQKYSGLSHHLKQLLQHTFNLFRTVFLSTDLHLIPCAGLIEYMMGLRPRQGNLRLVFRLFSQCEACRAKDLNNLKTSLGLPCRGHNPNIDYFSHQLYIYITKMSINAKTFLQAITIYFQLVFNLLI